MEQTIRKRTLVSRGITGVFASLVLLIASTGRAQTPAAPPAAGAPAAAAPAAPAAASSPAAPAAAASPTPPLSSPSVTGPLTMASPTVVDLSTLPFLANLPGASDLGKIDLNGVASGIGMVQNHADLYDKTARADVSNAFLILQKPDGIVQFYLQVGAYDSLALGTPYVSAGKAVSDLYGPLPVAYLKIAPTDNFSIEAGNLPTLIGAEYTFTFENINVERGLLWNQENAVNRGVQLNYNQGPVSASLSWNNGFYSDSYTWLTGSLAYAFNSANSLSVVGGGNLGYDKHSSFVAPALLNNSEIYNLIYTYSSAPWIIQPYMQWTYVPKNTAIGALESTSTIGGAVLASYAVTDNFFMAARAEYIGSTGNSVNLLYGPGSEAWSLTLTPTYQYKQFFVRPEVSYVQAMGYTKGDVFGSTGAHPAQVRGLLELGLLL